MSIRIGSNISALQAQRRLSESSSALSRAFDRLSSGRRINRASDDAAGLAIAGTLDAKTRIFEKGIRNLNDGISFTNIADQAAKELKTILIRQRELAAQSSNGSYSDRQRQSLEAELKQLSFEWNRVLDSATFNGRKVFSAKEGSLTLQAGLGADAVLSAGFGSTEAAAQDDMRLVSAALDGTAGNFDSDGASISADGRFVAFSSSASNLIGGALIPATSTSVDMVFSSGWGFNSDGAGDCFYLILPNFEGYFWFNVTDGSTWDPSDPEARGATGYQIDIASDWDADQIRDAFQAAVDAAGGGLITTSDSGEGCINIAASIPGLSYDTDAFAYWGNLGGGISVTSINPGTNEAYTGDTNGVTDVFVKDLQTGEIRLVSSSSNGALGNSGSFAPSISADGRYVAFTSTASNLVPGDTNSNYDVFIKDLQTGVTRRVSTTSSGTQASGQSLGSSISADGRYVAFSSFASNFPGGGSENVYRKDLLTGELKIVSTSSAGTICGGSNAAISADGRYLAFYSSSSNLVANDTNGALDVFIKDLETGETRRVSTDSSGAQGNNNSSSPAISADGRYVAFHSASSNLVSGDTNGHYDIFIKDLLTGATRRVSTSSNEAQGNHQSLDAVISADGRYIAFESTSSNLVSGDDGFTDVFIKDLQTGELRKMSAPSSGGLANGTSAYAALSADGRYVAFGSFASNLASGDGNGCKDSFVAGNPLSGWSNLSRNQWLSVATRQEALLAQSTLDKYLTELNSIEGSLGVIETRLGTALGTLQTMTENFRSAESRITNADMAEETANLVRTQIVQKTATAVLGQANQEHQIALRLLKQSGI